MTYSSPSLNLSWYVRRQELGWMDSTDFPRSLPFQSKHIDSPSSLDGSESERKVGLYDENAETSVQDFSAEEERALLRKVRPRTAIPQPPLALAHVWHSPRAQIDWHVLPLLIAAYLIKNIDGNAISYVKIMNKGEPGNILTMLDITADQFTWTATVFTIPFMLAEIPSSEFSVLGKSVADCPLTCCLSTDRSALQGIWSSRSLHSHHRRVVHRLRLRCGKQESGGPARVEVLPRSSRSPFPPPSAPC